MYVVRTHIPGNNDFLFRVNAGKIDVRVDELSKVINRFSKENCILSSPQKIIYLDLLGSQRKKVYGVVLLAGHFPMTNSSQVLAAGERWQNSKNFLSLPFSFPQ